MSDTAQFDYMICLQPFKKGQCKVPSYFGSHVQVKLDRENCSTSGPNMPDYDFKETMLNDIIGGICYINGRVYFIAD